MELGYFDDLGGDSGTLECLSKPVIIITKGIITFCFFSGVSCALLIRGMLELNYQTCRCPAQLSSGIRGGGAFSLTSVLLSRIEMVLGSRLGRFASTEGLNTLLKPLHTHACN